jgi:hypothetical protein
MECDLQNKIIKQINHFLFFNIIKELLVFLILGF